MSVPIIGSRVRTKQRRVGVVIGLDPLFYVVLLNRYSEPERFKGWALTVIP